jgi:uncharacterized coiled-coil protein SlyX
MSDDLVRQLRGGYVVDYDEENQIALCKEAADRIEELERQLALEKQYFKEVNDKAWDVHSRVHELEKQAEYLVYALKTIVSVERPKEWHGFCEEVIAETLKILEEKKDDR